MLYAPKEPTWSQNTFPGFDDRVALPVLVLALVVRGEPFEPVEGDEPHQCDEVDVVVGEQHERAQFALGDARAGLLDLGEEVDEDVGDRDAAGERQRSAPGDAAEEP
jgi:hypothetical protein